jgi:hypothetical protein
VAFLKDFLLDIISLILSLWRRDDPEDEPDPEEEEDPLEPGDVFMVLDDGTELRAAMFLDRDGNETDSLLDAVTVLAHHERSGWYELDLKAGTWEIPTRH